MAFVVTAIGAAIELGTVAAIATAVSEVGIALSVVGAVTGNKDLIKIGSVLGLAGGVAGLAASFATGATDLAVEGAATGAADATTGTVANEAASAADYANSADLASDAATKSASGAAQSSLAPVGDALNAPALTAQPAGIVADATGAPSLAPQMQTVPTVADTQAPSLGAQAPAGAQAPTGPQAPYTPFEENFVGSNALSASPNAGTGSLFDQFSGWVKANPKLAELGMQVVGGGLKGMSDYSLQQQRLAQQQQMINLQSYGNQVGTWAPISRKTGIVGGAMG